MREIELLAPARDLQTGIEAIRHGADAVYIGAARFGARVAAGNSVEDIAELVRFARAYKVKVYVTLNTILYDNELDDARRLVGELSDAGVDALIVQDMAFVNSKLKIQNSKLASGDTGEEAQGRSHNPQFSLPLHASTQMDNRTAEKVAWLRDLGFEQVVLARELTLEEIREIHQRVPDVRLEAFVHGAICVSYNGQCYASQYCFGRSANRGECAQFCRMPFDLVDADGNVLQRQRYLLSLRDMNRSAELEALLDAGVSSLKIEGRLKDVSYVKNVVAYYRQRLDDIFRRRTEYRRSSLGHETITFTPNPAKSFNRLFTNYFLYGRTPNMANIYTPKSMGEPIESLPREGLLHNGDGLCYINEEGKLVGFRIDRADKFSLSSLPNVVAFYRNHDHEFEQLLAKPTATRKVYVRWLLKDVSEGFLLRLTREDGATTEQTFPYPHELARTPQEEQIARQLSRLGDTPYESTGIDIELSDNWFIPGSVLAEWRRLIGGKGQEVRGKRNDLGGKEQEVRGKRNDFRNGENTQEAGQSSYLLPPTSYLQNSPTSYLQNSSLSYLANVSNHVARQFYLDHGARQVEWAMEVEQPMRKKSEGLLIMTCRYCIRRELGMCKAPLPAPPVGGRAPYPLEDFVGEGKPSPSVVADLKSATHESGISNPLQPAGSPLFLRLANGRRFRLRFDCKKCQMEVYAE